MTAVVLHYTRQKRGRLFWEPTKQMRAKGFAAKPLGAADDPQAIAEAQRLYKAWQTVQSEGDARPTKYPEGTLGAFWDRYKAVKKWKKPRTREGYERAWKRIDAWRPAGDAPTLANTVVTKITTELCEAFADHLEVAHSASERYRTIQILKAIMRQAAIRLRLGYESPARAVTNPLPSGRTAFWLGAEIDQLSDRARAGGMEGISLAVRLAWETMFSPVDIWTLQIPQMKRDAEGFYLEGERTKTMKETFAAVSDSLAADILAYIGERRVGPIIVMKRGEPYRNGNRFNKDFRKARKLAFGEKEARQCMDIRRSANVEADAAGADKVTMAKLLANRIDTSRFLEETYTPPTVAKAREVARLRVEGRQRLAHEIMRSNSGPK